jgi:hypothetical protein
MLLMASFGKLRFLIFLRTTRFPVKLLHPKQSLGFCRVCFTLHLRGRIDSVPLFEQLSFVDLAGSERVKKSGSAGKQLKEAQSINKSLSVLLMLLVLYLLMDNIVGDLRRPKVLKNRI